MAKRSFWKMPATLAAFGLAFALVLTGCPNGNDPNNNLPGDNQPGNGNGGIGVYDRLELRLELYQRKPKPCLLPTLAT